MLSGDYLASIPARFDFWFSEAILLVAFQGALTFVAFLAGVLAARAGALTSNGLAAHTCEDDGLGSGPWPGPAAVLWRAVVGQHSLRCALRRPWSWGPSLEASSPRRCSVSVMWGLC